MIRQNIKKTNGKEESEDDLDNETRQWMLSILHQRSILAIEATLR